MKWYALGLMIVMTSLYAKDAKIPESAFDIDTVKAVVFGLGGTQLITHSDILRPSLSGAPRTMEDLIFERLVFLDAQKFKILSDDEAVDKYLAAVQKENNLTLDQLKEVFASAGYSFQEGREQFKILQTVNSMLDFKIRSQVIVPRKQVEEYYDQNPEVQEASYYLLYGFVPYAVGKQKAQKRALMYMVKTGKEIRGIEWGEPFWVLHSEVAPEKEFIFSMKPGTISQASDRGDGFEVYQLLENRPERVASLEERYKEIADILRRPAFDDLMEKYKKGLYDSVSILYL